VLATDDARAPRIGGQPLSNPIAALPVSRAAAFPKPLLNARSASLTPYALRVEFGQQTGSKRLKSASLNHAERSREKADKPPE